jgi:hypothetical protein
MRAVFVLVWIYAGLGVMAAGYAWYKGAYDPAHSEFAGLPLLLLALPWSWIFRDANPRLLGDEYNNNVLIETIFVVLNTAVLAAVLILIQKRIIRSKVKT